MMQEEKNNNLSHSYVDSVPNNNSVEMYLMDAKKNGWNAISLKDKHLISIPAKLFTLENLTSLDLSNNTITQIPFEISKLKNLRALKLSGNKTIEGLSAIGQLKKLTELDLSRCGLTHVPDSIFQLENLAVLHLDQNQIIHISPNIGKLLSLRVLTLSNNKIIELPTELSQLCDLRYLKLEWNQLGRLPKEIKHLNSLRNLDLNHNKFKKFPKVLRQLKGLRVLKISHGNFIELPGNIENLKSLKELDLSFCGLKVLSPAIAKIQTLETLNLSHNHLKDIPVEIRNQGKLKFLDLDNNGLFIPPEILEKKNNPQIILDYFFSSIGLKKYPLNEVKLLVVGQGSVGKTSLLQKIINNVYSPNHTKTEGISISQWSVKNRKSQNVNSNIRVNTWDFGGQEIMHATHQFFLTKRSLYLLVLDSRLTQEENRVEYWLKIIQSFGGESPVLIIGNKTDQHPLDIDRTGLQRKYPNIVGILETSAATGAGIEELKAAITEHVNNLPHVRDLLPETWFTVKTKLEELGKQSNFISHDKYLELCAENEVSDESSQRTLIGFLHDLGVVLHFQDDPRLEALGILNPQWVTNGVYKILNSHALFQNKGVLTVSMLDEILNLPEYPRGKRLFIVDMMKKFELCYDIPYGYDVEPDKTFLVPDLLPKDQPDLNFTGVPAFEYAYPVLPSSVITRFIVRMNQKIDDGFVWRTGVVLKIGGNKALVKADIEDRKITIAIDGVEHTRRDVLSAIRYQLDEIHASIKGLDAQKRVPVPNAPNAEPLEYDYLLMLEREGDETCRVKDGSRLVTVNVRQILSGIESETQRKEAASRVINIYGDVKDSNILAGDDNEVKK
jgi:internalin A